jgi:hypothetical protein
MTAREKLREYADVLPEEEILRLLRTIEANRPSTRAELRESPSEFIKRIGPWQDSRTTEEIIRDIYDSRTSSEAVDL